MYLGGVIKEYREAHGMTMKEFANKAGLSKGYISMLEKNQHPQNKREIVPSLDTFKKSAKAMNVSMDDLMKMVDSDQPVSLKKNLDISDFDNIYPIETKRIPLLGDIACGQPIYANEDRESYILAGTDIDADFCLKAKGDSMIGARINDGDIVFIKKQDIVENGEIAAVIIDDEATLKRVYYERDRNRLMLQAENPKYRPYAYEGEELDHIRILGKAIAFQSDII